MENREYSQPEMASEINVHKNILCRVALRK